MNKIFSYISVFLILNACQYNSPDIKSEVLKDNSKVDSSEKEPQKQIEENNIDLRDLQKIDLPINQDSLTDICLGNFAYFTTELFSGIINYYPSDNGFFSLIIANVNGEIIDTIPLSFGNCGSDCGIYCGTEIFVINTDLTIYKEQKVDFRYCEDEKFNANDYYSEIEKEYIKLSGNGSVVEHQADTMVIRPDSNELKSISENSVEYEIADKYSEEFIRINFTSDSTIHYWIRFVSKETGCESIFFGDAFAENYQLDPEIDEYQGESYSSTEYIPIEQLELINSLRIALDKSKIIITAKSTNNNWGDCYPILNEVILKK